MIGQCSLVVDDMRTRPCWLSNAPMDFSRAVVGSDSTVACARKRGGHVTVGPPPTTTRGKSMGLPDNTMKNLIFNIKTVMIGVI